MRAITQIVFDDEELRVFEETALAMNVGFPDPKWDEPYRRKPKNEDAKAQIILNRLQRVNEKYDADYLARALDVMNRLIAVLEVESTPEHWQRQTRPVYSKPREGGVALFTDPQQVIDVLIESRKRFLRYADIAAGLLRAALTQFSEEVSGQ